MRHHVLCAGVVLGALLVAGCQHTGKVGAAPVAASTPSPHARIPNALAGFRLTERAPIRGMEPDSLYRFRDSTRANVTVFVYSVPPDVSADGDAQRWTVREGEKFRASQDVRRSRRQIVAYELVISDTTRLEGNRAILEHRSVSPTRYPGGAVTVEMQYLYLIDGRFVKVRATVPAQGWEQTQVPTFARALALHVARGT